MGEGSLPRWGQPAPDPKPADAEKLKQVSETDTAAPAVPPIENLKPASALEQAPERTPSRADQRGEATPLLDRPLSNLEKARARAPKATDPGHVHEPKRKLTLGGTEWSICRCGLTHRGDDKWATTVSFTKGGAPRS